MITRKPSRRILKILCHITIVFLIIVATVVTTLSLTIFKRKEPRVHLENFHLTYLSNETITVKVVVKVKNPNYESFKYKNTTASITYRGIIVALVPIEPRFVPARGKLNFTITSVDLLVYKMVENPKFFEDIVSYGGFNFTSSATLHGKVGILKFLKFHAKVFCTCDISYLILSQNVTSRCMTKVKL